MLCFCVPETDGVFLYFKGKKYFSLQVFSPSALSKHISGLFFSAFMAHSSF